MLSSKGFDLWADGYDISVGLSDESDTYPFAGYKAVLGSIFSTIMESGKKRVLDIGFGTGTLTSKLYEHGCEIFGQDFSAHMIELAQAKMPEAKLYQGDFSEGLAAPIACEKFDFIIATYSLHHLTNDAKVSFIDRLMGLLNDGGMLLIGDVAFENAETHEKCRTACGEEWDDEEFYFIYDDMRNVFPQLTFDKKSCCAAVLSMKK